MSVTPSQLSEIHKDLIEYFISHPIISIKPAKGDPPEQYDVSYQILGMSQSKDGEVNESFGHMINLTIPFGYPHFPPSCKPKSQIFHPDFDPAAICLGTSWEQSQSLPELIVNIGRMLNGEIYSDSNVFNEEAGEWYEKHSDKFPLSDITWSSGFNHKEDRKKHTVDTLDDSDLSTDFNFHEINLNDDSDNDNISISDSFPEIDSSPSSEIDYNEFNQLQNQKKYFKLQQTLKGAAHTSEELSSLAERCIKEIDKAKKLYTQAKKYEHQGDLQRALNLLEQTAFTASDFPSVDADINRVQQSLTLLEDVSPDPLDSSPVEPHPSPPVVSTPRKAQESSAKKANTSQTETPFFETKRKQTKLIVFIVLALISLGLLAGGYIWYSASNNLTAAQAELDKCKSLLLDNKYVTSKKACTKGIELSSKVLFIKQTKTDAIRISLNKILQSEKLSQGIAGNVFIDGKYLSKVDAEQQNLIHITEKNATNAFNDEQWKDALNLHIKLAQLINHNKLTTSISKDEIDHRIALCKFRILFDKAEKILSTKNWDEAHEQFELTKLLLKELPPQARTYYEEQLLTNIGLCQFNKMKEQGDIAFSESRWQEASSLYSNAISSLKQKNQILPEAINIIQSNNKRAQLYKTITEGNQAYSSANWDAAIVAYNRADTFIHSNKELLTKSDANLSLEKIAQIRLQALINRDRQLAEEQLTEENLKMARTTYLNIVENIDQSPYSGTEMFASSRKKILDKIEKLETDIAHEEKIRYLTENFQPLFISNYSASTKEKLTKPVVTFTQEVGNKFVYRLQCTDIGSGHPLTLVMFYAYDKKSKSWALFSDQ